MRQLIDKVKPGTVYHPYGWANGCVVEGLAQRQEGPETTDFLTNDSGQATANNNNNNNNEPFIALCLTLGVIR